MPDQEDEDPLLACVVYGDESDALICDKCWDDYKRVAGIIGPDEQ